MSEEEIAKAIAFMQESVQRLIAGEALQFKCDSGLIFSLIITTVPGSGKAMIETQTERVASEQEIQEIDQHVETLIEFMGVEHAGPIVFKSGAEAERFKRQFFGGGQG